MLTYTFDENRKTALYEQLYRFIKQDISLGKLSAGEKLPSKRALARHLHLGIITVQNAYAQLAVEGYIVTRERSGYFVAELEARLPPPAAPEPAPEPEREHPAFLLDLRTNRINAESFPFSVWSRLMRQTILDRSSKLLEPLPQNGAYALREAIAQHLYSFRGMTVRPENIVVAAGTEVLENFIVQLLGRGRVYALEDPGYAKVAQVCTAAGAEVAFIPLDGMGMAVPELRKSGASVVHLSPAHHYPTGIVMPISRRRELLRWAHDRGGYIIEDDYDSEFRFSGRPVETLQSIDSGGSVIYMNTFSKSIAPSIRISYMVLPDALLEAYRKKLGFYSCTVPGFEQYTLAQFIKGGHFEHHIARMKNYYKALRGQVIAAIDALPYRDKITIAEEHAGLHFLLKLDTDLPDTALLARAAALGVKIACLSEFSSLHAHRFAHTLVVNYSGVTPAQLAQFRRCIETDKAPLPANRS